jgi:hypothetical protein
VVLVALDARLLKPDAFDSDIEKSARTAEKCEFSARETAKVESSGVSEDTLRQNKVRWAACPRLRDSRLAQDGGLDAHQKAVLERRKRGNAGISGPDGRSARQEGPFSAQKQRDAVPRGPR